MTRVPQKWRPPLWLVLGAMLAVVLVLPVMGFVSLRFLVPDLGWRVSVTIVSFIVLGITGVLAWLFLRLLLRPVGSLSAHARALEERREASPPLARFGTRELAGLGQSVLSMGAALDARAGELEAYAAHVVHELRTPLTALKASAELMGDEQLPVEDRARLASRQLAHVARLEHLLSALQDLARAGQSRRQPWRPIAEDAEAVAQALGLGCAVQGTPQLPLSEASTRIVLEQMIQNAAQNGAKSVQVCEAPNGVEISDDGMGISLGNRGRIFDTFFTTRRESGGTGMGLAIVQRLI
ncbi:MAG: sensor histidine kinase, partial [Shimia sp.]